MASGPGLSGDFEIRTSDGGVPVICRKAEAPWAIEPAADGESAATPAGAAAGRAKTRLTKESGERAAVEGKKIGGPFKRQADPTWLRDRAAVYDEVMATQAARLASKPAVPIEITLPDGTVKEGVSWRTTPMQIAEGISKGLAGSAVVAKVAYLSRIGVEEADGANVVNTGPEEEAADDGSGAAAGPAWELWDLTRPLEGSCRLQLLKFDDKDARMVFWHSSAHILGECLECSYGGKLCIGPPTEEGFYYDAYMGDQ
jgi:threonyl-tRNA synthetase